MQQTTSSKIVVMTAGGLNPQVMINELAAHFTDLHVIEERPETKGEILRRRTRNLGWLNASGQMATMIASRLSKKLAARRSQEILRQYGLSGEPKPDIPVTQVTSLNSAECHAAVTGLAPLVVFTISCRILSKATLAAIPCPIINFHAGINPMYRGQMGGYWSRVERDEQNFGATVHLVDAGIDTGESLYEQRVSPAKSDMIATYPLLITAASTGIAIRAIEDAISGNLRPYRPSGKSALKYPPTIWMWLWHGITKGIW
ncbi:formyl transferase [Aliirhizobium terrae]|uniref:formyl transferase n=1 Tax=Terrirhizobium terrae TaxID=2926709 RepID=UPI002578EDA3|nr:formyl transferase [Rhizobium sp. CC-CFT758]WJH40078.1 formyl transferase [Rhizobium sp. CC-CFT758]